MPVARFPEVLNDLRTKILDGTYPAGEPLPHTEELMREYGCSRHVITSAMRELKAEGRVRRAANKGMIVQRPPAVIEIPMAVERRNEPIVFMNACMSAGTTGRLIEQAPQTVLPPGEILESLRLGPDHPVLYFEGHGVVDDQIVCLDQWYLATEEPEAKASSADPSSDVLDIHTQIHLADPKEASQLRVSRGSPLLDITRIAYDDTGQPLHLLRRLINPQRIHIVDQRLPPTSP
ncbi:DNA-binding transcriptional regulator, GntR family [Sinosporangium album]|uniref:DNA-binding transcriptional regulator, GntR family n=1 Tax=Sinosporangium album TaxID=504805 RepID=A0A1G8IN94_9ACTN|nr:GntR family transcriptional regulator [Sinosporangium album]SDI20385.1 DNA-binding transcriptional regulator, GntR family [Sinosporangium album]